MAIEKVLATDLNYLNLTIYRRMNGTTQIGYEMVANEGYVFYDTTEENYEQPAPDSEPIPVIYYHTIAFLPTNYNFANFPYVAVPRDSVDENYIFGGGDDNHEVM